MWKTSEVIRILITFSFLALVHGEIFEVMEAELKKQYCSVVKQYRSQQDFIMCHCKRYCIDKRCKCRSKNIKCNSKCHSAFLSGLELPENLIFEKKANLSGDIKFFLYTRKNPLNYEEFLLDNFFLLRTTNFNANKPIKILVHGWKCFYGSTFNVLVKNAYLTQYDVNVIVVDWSKYSQLFYPYSRYWVVDIAEIIAKLIDKLCDELEINPDNIHLVGHSLGAHVAGIVGLKTARKLNRITGLDPAGPYFRISDAERISSNSAKFVDIIHTDGRYAGFYGSLGHVDFYPNGGTAIQPGCGWDVLTLRSHRRAYWLFAESITTPEGFSAVPCDSWEHFEQNNCKDGNLTVMGEHVSPRARGAYYLRTNYKTPFALETVEKIMSNKK